MAIQPVRKPSDARSEAAIAPARASNPLELIEAKYGSFPRKGLIAGLLLCPVVIYWSEYTEIVSGGADLIAMSLVMSVVCLFLALLAVNVVLRRFVPRLAFSRSDLLMIYIVNSVSIGITGLGMLQYLVSYLCGASYYRTTENGWGAWAHLLKPWAMPNPSVVQSFYDGHASAFTPSVMLGWLSPVLAWSFFIVILLSCFYCMAVLLRRQWMDSEHLQFPIAMIPIEIMNESTERPIWRDKVMWNGFALALVVETLAVIHYSFKITFPYIPIKPSENAFDLTQYFTAAPWNGMGYFRAALYPLVIGMTFMLSLDISFSCWFFVVVTHVENVVATFYGYRAPLDDQWLGGAPYLGFQGIGAFAVLGLAALATALPHLKSAFRQAFLGAKEEGQGDGDEPMTIRAAFIGFVASAIGLVGFACALGIGLPISIALVALMLLFAVVTTRIRAEAGLPYSVGPVPLAHGTLITLLGSHALGPQAMVGLTMIRPLDSDPRTMAMPFQMEAMKIARDARIHPRHLTIAVVAAVITALVSGWICILGLYYHYGALTTENWRLIQGPTGFGDLNSWLVRPTGMRWPGFAGVAAGAAVAMILIGLRRTLLWWPLHPLGFAFANCDPVGWFWLPILIGWFCKSVVLKYGGTVGYRRTLPFFIGLILGDYVAGGGWSLFFLLTGIPGYRTFPW